VEPNIARNRIPHAGQGQRRRSESFSGKTGILQREDGNALSDKHRLNARPGLRKCTPRLNRAIMWSCGIQYAAKRKPDKGIPTELPQISHKSLTAQAVILTKVMDTSEA
jgi:hypothetical protein